MSYVVAKTKEEGLSQLTELVRSFNNNRKTFTSTNYNETQLRNDFLNPFLKSFGWDVDNINSKDQFIREVIQEEPIRVEDETSKKNPDYTLRILGHRKLFIEAKKPSIDIVNSTKSAFQIRRYGWNANLGISALTNFDKLIIYDCRHKPNITENGNVARIEIFDFLEYIDRFEEIYNLISFETATSGKLDDLFSIYDRTGQTFDDYFLEQIEKWRSKLAHSAFNRNSHLGSEDINFLIQRLLNRIVFLRICEDRTIEKYETLKFITSYDQLKSLFLLSDRKYNSGLFDFIEDDLSLNIEIDSDILIEIFNDLYYPLSPYDFAVVDPAILSQIYEKFLGSQVVLDDARQLSIVLEPEVVASNGVVSTPKLIVEQIVKETLTPLLQNKTFHAISDLKIADICCGSGTFLISVFDYLMKESIQRLDKEKIKDQKLIYEKSDGTFALSLKTKRDIIKNNIFGVDINPYASEVTEFSLLLKLLEGESGPSIDHFINQYSSKVLPSLSSNIKCGNSLVDEIFFDFMPDALNDNKLLYRIKPFNWSAEFPFLKSRKGFDAIVGNPPYVRIQNLKKYSPDEVNYYQTKLSGFIVAKKEAVDKYFIFIQRAIALLNDSGFLGYIVPHKFFINKGGAALREYICAHANLCKIFHFGVTQVFPDRSTYTAILIIQKTKKDIFEFKRFRRITPYLLDSKDGYLTYNQSDFTDSPWIFLSRETQRIFAKLKSKQTLPLSRLAEICVGLQTSKDDIYIFKVLEESDPTFKFNSNGLIWSVEKAICVPCIYDLSFSLFGNISPNAQMIFPYKIEDGKAILYSEEYLAGNFPLCWKYLNAHKTALEKRSLNGKNPKWYQFGRSQSLTKFHNTPKVIWPVLSTEPSYIYDELNIQFTGGGNGPYYSLINKSPLSIYYFLGILAHPLFERMVKAGASEFRGAYYSHGKQFIENIPIKSIDFDNNNEIQCYKEIIKTVKSLMLVKVQLDSVYGSNKIVLNRKISMLNNKLVNVINLLYGISEEEFNSVVNDEMFLNELTAEE